MGSRQVKEDESEEDEQEEARIRLREGDSGQGEACARPQVRRAGYTGPAGRRSGRLVEG